MKCKVFRRSHVRIAALSSSTLLAILLPQTVQAQEAAQEGDAIVVTGSILQSQAASIEAKRIAINLVDVASADAVGRFPDQNSAAALSRLPAVAVQRDQGQERYIQIRGAPNRWTSVMIDGVPMIGVDEGGDTRAFRFDAVPAVLLSSMVINKSLTPALQADAIVASIDLRTYSPLAQDGLHVSGDLGYGMMDQGEGEQRQGSLRVSWANDVIGIVVGGSQYRREQLTDNREVGLFDDPANAADTTFGPTEIDIRQYQIERWSNGLFSGIEYAPADGERFYAKVIFTEFSDDEQRNQYELRLDRAAAGVRNHTSGDLLAVPVRGSFNYGEYRNRNYIGTFGGEIERDNGFSAELKFNYARTDNDTYLPLVQASTGSGLASPSLTYDRRDTRFPIVTLHQTIVGALPGTFARGAVITAFNQRSLSAAGALYIAARQNTVSDSYTAMLDLEQDFGAVTLLGGALIADRSITGNNFSFANTSLIGTQGALVGKPFDVNSYVTNQPWQTQFPLGFTLNYVDNAAMRRDIDALIPALTAAGLFNPANDVPFTDRYDQDELTIAAYAMAIGEFDALTLTGGVRLENYSLDNSGTARIGGVNSSLRVDDSKTDLFPSLNVRYEISDNFVARFGAQRGVSRPAYGAIRVGSSINDTASPGTIGGGNPGLEAEYTWGVDASLELYASRSSIISVAGFHRWVDNVFYQNTQAVGTDVFDSGGIDRTNYLLTSTFNGQNGRLYGVEFNFQQQFTFLPEPLDGFGFQGNLTLLDGSFDTQLVVGVQRLGIRFPGMSNTLSNASLYFEKYGISARVSYQRRSDWLDGIGGFGAGESRKGYENLDVSLRYQLTDNFTVFADAANLTDAKYIAYEGKPDRVSEVEQIGERYMAGFRFSF